VVPAQNIADISRVLAYAAAGDHADNAIFLGSCDRLGKLFARITSGELQLQERRNFAFVFIWTPADEPSDFRI